MFTVAVISKLVGCGLSAKAFKMTSKESLQIGVGMVSRGEVAIITASLGVHNNIILQEIFVAIVLIVLLTTVVTPILLKVAFD